MMAVTATMIATWMAVFADRLGACSWSDCFALLDESACVVSGVVLMPVRFAIIQALDTGHATRVGRRREGVSAGS